MQIQKVAKTVSLAIDEALKDLDTTIDKIEFEVLQEPRSGFFGIGKKPAKVLIKLIEPEKFEEEIRLEISKNQEEIKENIKNIVKNEVICDEPIILNNIVEDVKDIENIKNIEHADPVKNIESIKNIEHADPVKNIESIKNIEHADPVKNIESIKNIEHADPVKNIENIKNIIVKDDTVNNNIISEDTPIITDINTNTSNVINKKPINTEAPYIAMQFLINVFEKMDLDINITAVIDEKNELLIDLKGNNVGIAIGKRGQTLDSLQYLVTLVINKGDFAYMSVSIDTEKYRQRRKQTLETLALNLAKKANKIGKNVNIEPMNPYERRIIHAKLQTDTTIKTYSVGDEPFRYVVISPRNSKNKNSGNKNKNNNISNSNNKNKNKNKNNSINKNNSSKNNNSKDNNSKDNNSKDDNSKDDNSKVIDNNNNNIKNIIV